MAAQDMLYYSTIEDDVRVTSKVEPDRRHQINQYIRQERIGRGQHGEVFRCIDESLHGREVALKIVKRHNPRDKIKLLRRTHQTTSKDGKAVSSPPLSSTENSVRKEVAVMKKCRHANIARLFEVIDDPKHEKIYLAMEYLSGGQVQWKDEEDRPILSVNATRRIIRDVVLGLEYLHHHGIVHRDIKPANLIWTTDRAIVKIIDFGVSYFHHKVPESEPTSKPSKQSGGPYNDSLFEKKDLLKRTGTPSFLAPEIVWFSDDITHQHPTASWETLPPAGTPQLPPGRPPITKAIDIWSLAVTLYCFLFGHTPFNAPESANENVYHNEFALYNQICTQDWDVDETMGFDQIRTSGRHPREHKSEGAMVVSLLDQMLQKDPTNRITISEIKQNPWVLRGIPEPQEWIARTSPQTFPPASLPSRKSPTLPMSRWRQASQKIWEFVPRPRRS